MQQGAGQSVFLVGPMGSGKTAVGRQLAARLGYRFVDSDAEIEVRTGVDIPFIFEKEGEQGFREREREVIDELTQAPGIVLATGGGAVMTDANRVHLAARGIVVYLETSVDQQLARTRRSTNRPLLFTEDPRGRLEALLAVREPLYQSIATLTVRTNGRKVAAVVEEIAQKLHERQQGG
jgi:shikimate kinase